MFAQRHLLKSKGFIGLLVLAAIAVISSVLLFRASAPEVAVEPISTVTVDTASPTATALESAARSPLPVSPISPISPITVSGSSQLAALDAMFETGIAAYETEQYSEARDVFEAMLAINPQSARAHDALGTVQTALGDTEAAITSYSKAIELDPLFPPPYYNRGRTYGQLKKFDEALTDLRRSAQLAPFFFGYRAHGNIGLIYHEMGQYDRALAAYRESMEYDQGKADVFYLRGETHTALEDYDAAIADYQAAIDRFSNYPEASLALGYAYFKTGQYDEALTILNKSSDTSPQNPTTLLYLGLVYVATGQVERASEEVSQAIALSGSLSDDELRHVFSRVLGDLELLAQSRPDLADAIEEIMSVISEAEQ